MIRITAQLAALPHLVDTTRADFERRVLIGVERSDECEPILMRHAAQAFEESHIQGWDLGHRRVREE